MSIRETARSPQNRQHWLAEQVLRWSGLPVVTMRPTAFMDAFFWRFAVPTITAQDSLMLPFEEGRTSPIAAHDVARCVTEVLANPEPHIGKVYELIGPSAGQSASQHALSRGNHAGDLIERKAADIAVVPTSKALCNHWPRWASGTLEWNDCSGRSCNALRATKSQVDAVSASTWQCSSSDFEEARGKRSEEH